MKHLYTIADSDSCESLEPSACANCPLARLRLRQDGRGYMSCADAVGFQHDGDGSYARAAVSAIIDAIIEGSLDEYPRLDKEEDKEVAERDVPSARSTKHRQGTAANNPAAKDER